MIFSEKDGYLSQFAGIYELELPFKSDKVSEVGNSEDLYMSMASQVRENQELGTKTGLYNGRLILTEYVVKTV